MTAPSKYLVKIATAVQEAKNGSAKACRFLASALLQGLRESSGPTSPVIVRLVEHICVPLGAQIPPRANYRVIAAQWLHKLQQMADELKDPVHGNSKLSECQEHLAQTNEDTQ